MMDVLVAVLFSVGSLRRSIMALAKLIFLVSFVRPDQSFSSVS